MPTFRCWRAGRGRVGDPRRRTRTHANARDTKWLKDIQERSSRQVATKRMRNANIPLLEGGSRAGRGSPTADQNPCKCARHKVAKEHSGAIESPSNNKKDGECQIPLLGGGSRAGRGSPAADQNPCKRARRKVAKEHSRAIESPSSSKKDEKCQIPLLEGGSRRKFFCYKRMGSQGRRRTNKNFGCTGSITP